MRILGIDPGSNKSGAYAVLQDGQWVASNLLPLAGGWASAGQQVHELLAHIAPDLAIVEYASPRPGAGVTGMFKYGGAYALVLGVIGIIGTPVKLVVPQIWKPAMALGRDKDNSIALALELYPNSNLVPQPRGRANNHNIAEAVLIARWGAIFYGDIA